MTEEKPPQHDEEAAGQTQKDRQADMRSVLAQLAADFENFRKDATQGLQEAERFGVRTFILSLSPALASFSLALKKAEGKVDGQYVKGFQKVYEQFLQALEAQGIVPISPKAGEVYDPKFHEAVERVKGEAYRTMGVVEGGWMFKGGEQVIVPAKVKVGDGSS